MITRFGGAMKKAFLFILFLCVPVLLFAQKKNSNILKNPDNEEVHIIPEEGQSLITNTTIKFQALIQDVRPGQVEIEAPQETEDVVFKSLRRTEDFSEQGGTRVELSLSFKKSGVYELEPLNVKVKGKTKKLPFEKLTIKPNPMELSPNLIITFKGGGTVTSKDGVENTVIKNVRTGDKLYFRLNLQYAVQLVQYNWELPKNSIFTELEKYDITEIKTRDKVYSEELIPVADFEWIPLVEGKMEFPQFKLTATCYNGIKNNLVPPKFYINVLPARQTADKSETTYFDDAFTVEAVAEDSASEIVITAAECQRIADLRSRERHSLSFGITKERAEYEKSLKLPYEKKEFPVILLILAIVLVLAATFFLVVFIYRKMPLSYIFMGVMEVCSIIFMIFCIVQSSARYGISKGCKIFSIPEVNAESKSEIPAGNRISITEETGDWIYVELGENGGWCKKEDVIEIR